jgi:hypothetical protein
LTEKAFQKLFLEAVDAAFSSLGDSVRQSIYFHLQSKFNITRDEIPCRLKDFENGLEKIFGEGNRFLEVLIMKNLHERIGQRNAPIKWEEGKEFKFIDYVKAAERNFTHTKKEKKLIQQTR